MQLSSPVSPLFPSAARPISVPISNSASSVSAYNLGFGSMMRDLNCTQFQAALGLSVYPLGFAVVPMFTASFSEEFGRRPLYLWTAVGFELTFVMIALCAFYFIRSLMLCDHLILAGLPISKLSSLVDSYKVLSPQLELQWSEEQ